MTHRRLSLQPTAQSGRVGPCIAILCLTAFANPQAFGQTPDLTELSFESLTTLQVSTASKFSQSTREAPSAVTVIRREDIRHYGWRTLAEALNSLPGIYTVNDRAYDYVGARGFLVPGDYNSRFLLLIDGQRLNDNIYQQAQFGQDFPLDLALVERIEYVPGPGSSIYGGNAIFGVVNVITRQAEEMPPFSLSGFLSQDGWMQTRATSVLRAESGASLLASASIATKQGKDTTYDDPEGRLIRQDGTASTDGTAHHLDNQRTQRLFLHYENGGFSLMGRFGQRVVNPSSALYSTVFDDSGFRIKDGSWSISGRYQGRLSDTLNYETRLEMAESRYVADYPLLDSTNQRYINRDDTVGRWWSGEARLLYSGFTNQKLVGGAEIQHDQTALQRNYDLNAGHTSPISIQSRQQRTGLYVQDEWAFAPNWRLNTGVRHDNSSGRSVLSPRVGVIWLASEERTLKFLGGRAFRMPNAYERDFTNGTDNLANPGLKNESISTLEAVLEERFGNQHILTASAFDYKISHLISLVTNADGALQYQNQPDVHAQGLEAAWQSHWKSGEELASSLTYTQTRDAQGDRLSYSPRWIAKLRGSLPIFQDTWRVSAEASWLTHADYRWNGDSYRMPARFLLDVSLGSTRLTQNLNVQFRIRNVLDRRYSYPASDEAPVPAIPGQGRIFEVGLRYAM